MGKLSELLMNPILVKEFRGRMRTWKTMMIIVTYLLVLGGISIGFIFVEGGAGRFMNPGRTREIFIMICALQMGLIGFVAPGLSAGQISGERERQTLNILLTTQLSPTKIILSKFASSLGFITLLVLSTLPLYSLVVLYGGIGPGQILAVFGYCLMTMILFGAVGIFCSSWFKRTGVSTVVAYGITAFILGGTFMGAILAETAWQYVHRYAAAPVPFEQMFYLVGANPFASMVSIFVPDILYLGRSAANYPLPPWLYFLLIYLPLTVLLLFLAVRNLSPVKRPLFRRKGKKVQQQPQEVTVK